MTSKILDVAALAGVSAKTVSRVVNDEPGVSESTRRKVLEAVARLDYSPIVPPPTSAPGARG